MAFFFGDGFDLYALPADALLGYWDSGSTGSFVLGAGRFGGSRAIQSSTSAGYLVKSSGSNDAVHHFVCAYQQTNAVSGSTLGIYLQLTDGTTNQCCIVFRSDGAILLTSATPGGTVLATYTGAVTAASTWYAFEFEVVINNTTGSFAVRKNGNVSNDFSATSLNTRPGANAYANKLTVGAGSASSTLYLDDLLWRSDAVSVPWIGDVRCYTRMPNTDANVTWSRSGTIVPYMPWAAASGSGSGLGANIARYTSFTAPYSGTVGTVTIADNGTNASVNCKLAIYASSGSVPTTVLGSATPITGLTTGNVAFTFSTPVNITAGTQYFVAFDCDASTSPAGISLTLETGTGYTGATTYASFPAANPAGLSVAQGIAVRVVITPTVPANANYVSEPQQDAAASYVYSSTVGQADLYTLTGIDSTPTTIIGVTTRALAQKSDAGTRIITADLKSGGTTVHSGSGVLNTTWSWTYRTDLTDPNTGSAWTPTGVNNAQIGVTVTS